MILSNNGKYVVYKYIEIPSDKRLFIIGDTHGMYDLYKQGCKHLQITEEDFVISVGDLIDRGNKNLEMVLEFTSKPNRQAILGNHEDMLKLGLIDDNWFNCWIQNGGLKTYQEVTEYGINALHEMIKDLPVILEVSYRNKRYGFIHGGVPLRYCGQDYEIPTIANLVEKMKLNDQEIFNAVWDRDALESARYDRKNGNEEIPSIADVDYVFHGHTPVPSVEIYANRAYIDTGSCFNGRLTFVQIKDTGLSFYTTEGDGIA